MRAASPALVALRETRFARLPALLVVTTEELRIRSVPSGEVLQRIGVAGGILSADASPGGTLVAVIAGGRVTVFDRGEAGFEKAFGWSPNVSAVACSEEHTYACQEDGAVMLLGSDADPGEIGKLGFAATRMAAALSGDVFACADRERVAVVAPRSGVREILEDHIHDIAISADGAFVAVGGSSVDTVRIFDVVDGARLIRAHTDQVSVVAFQPDGPLLAAGDWDGGVYLYERPGFRCIAQFRAHSREVGALAFCGPYLATWSPRDDDDKVRLWIAGPGPELVGAFDP